MKSKATSLHPLLILLAVALVSVLFVVSCGDDDATAVPGTGAAEAAAAEAAELAATAEAAGEAEAAELAAVAAKAAETAVMAAEEAAAAEAAAEAAAQAGAPKRGGTLTMTIVAEHKTLDPPFHGGQVDISISQSLYDNLLMIQPDFSLKPELATSWEANDDFSSYTFQLRQGVKFHQGKEFKAEDVVFTFERVMALDAPITPIFSTVI